MLSVFCLSTWSKSKLDTSLYKYCFKVGRTCRASAPQLGSSSRKSFPSTWSVSAGWRSNHGDCQQEAAGSDPSGSRRPTCWSVSHLMNLLQARSCCSFWFAECRLVPCYMYKITDLPAAEARRWEVLEKHRLASRLKYNKYFSVPFLSNTRLERKGWEVKLSYLSSDDKITCFWRGKRWIHFGPLGCNNVRFSHCDNVLENISFMLTIIIILLLLLLCGAGL